MRYTIFVCFLLFAATTNAQEKCTVDRLSEERDRLAIQLKRASCFFSMDPNDCKGLKSAAGVGMFGAGAFAYGKAVQIKREELKKFALGLKNSKRDMIYYRNAVKFIDGKIAELTKQFYLKPDGKTWSQFDDFEETKKGERAILRQHKRKFFKSKKMYESLRGIVDQSIMPRLSQKIYWWKVLGYGGKIAAPATMVLDLSGDTPKCPATTVDWFSEFEGCDPLPVIGETGLKIFMATPEEMQLKINTYPKICDKISDIEKIYSAKIDALIESHIRGTDVDKVKCNGNSVEYVVIGDTGYGKTTFRAGLNEKSISTLKVSNSAPKPEKFELQMDYSNDGEQDTLQSFSWDPEVTKVKPFNGGTRVVGIEFKDATDHPMAMAMKVSTQIHHQHWEAVQSCCSGNAKDCPQEKKGRKQEAPAGEKTK